MKPKVRKSLHEAIEACDKVFLFTKALQFEQYAASDLVKSAVERQFEIIGEVTCLVNFGPFLAREDGVRKGRENFYEEESF